MSDLEVSQDGAVLTVLFNRPAARNAMTYAMYDGLEAACERADEDESVHVLVLRGAGGRAFVAGTDISQFLEFGSGGSTSGEDGVAYEARIERVVNRLEDVGVPTIAAVEGACVGGGLIIAAACDLRVATASGRFGVPVARTLGNCLSMNTYSLLVSHLGPARTLDMLLRARLLSATDAAATGFVGEVCADGELDAVLGELVTTLLGHAPLSMRAAKRAVARLRRANVPAGDDLVHEVFSSEDFRAGVAAFVSRGQVSWTGR
ncbi:Enoyl-CoA hydratase/carnithine racemase [Modestobacter sp. DSM 44400]|uniref:enoyl-CoA hydratase/isomerase family protein n=1 Tax=Modestobacter sp. DSM 44400 TaxID=1550230 RepID=UPI00089A5FB5|nr:enoyl-CoA hydratase/isomerase family protein [Modestobacter sp. DSM 44400]SDY25413.1 Enoyl-CoA hydratase/carnithine racemase [Modestobacter sp. DSM 44400]